MKAYRDVHDTDRCKLVQCLDCKDWVPKYEETRFCGNCGVEWGFEVHGRPSNIPRWAWDHGYREYTHVPRRSRSNESFHLKGRIYDNATGEPIGFGHYYETIVGISQGGLTNMKHMWPTIKRHLIQMQKDITYDTTLEATLWRNGRLVWTRKYPSPPRPGLCRRPIEQQTSPGQSVAFATKNALDVCQAIAVQ